MWLAAELRVAMKSPTIVVLHWSLLSLFVRACVAGEVFVDDQGVSAGAFLSKHCVACHGEANAESGLRIDELLKGETEPCPSAHSPAGASTTAARIIDHRVEGCFRSSQKAAGISSNAAPTSENRINAHC